MKAAMAVIEAGEWPNRMMPTDFGSWMRTEQKRIYLLCLKMLRDRDEADSVAQDVFVSAYRTLEKSGASVIQEPAKWLTRVALNTCCDRLRSKRWMFWQRRIASHAEERVLQLRPAAGLNPEDALLMRESGKRI
jgi:RNA polymerase sigma-70 factor, ECF subfamily